MLVQYLHWVIYVLACLNRGTSSENRQHLVAMMELVKLRLMG